MAAMMYPQVLLRPQRRNPLEKWQERVVWTLFALLWAALLARQFPSLEWWLADQEWVTPLFLVVTAWLTVQVLCQELPLQNALLAAMVIGGLGGAAHWLSQLSGVPLGPIAFADARGPSPFQEWALGAALLWVVALLNARGTARWLLRRVPDHSSRGLWTLGLSVLLVVWLTLGLEPYGSEIHRHWLWARTRLPVTWHGAPLTALFGWATVSLVALLAATPALLSKHPHPPPPGPQPAILWLAINGILGVAALTHGLVDVAVVVGAGLLWPAWTLVWRGRTPSRNDTSTAG
jgi:hypothetical protein